jgi:hypothetical protein
LAAVTCQQQQEQQQQQQGHVGMLLGGTAALQQQQQQQVKLQGPLVLKTRKGWSWSRRSPAGQLQAAGCAALLRLPDGRCQRALTLPCLGLAAAATALAGKG